MFIIIIIIIIIIIKKKKQVSSFHKKWIFFYLRHGRMLVSCFMTEIFPSDPIRIRKPRYEKTGFLHMRKQRHEER